MPKSAIVNVILYFVLLFGTVCVGYDEYLITKDVSQAGILIGTAAIVGILVNIRDWIMQERERAWQAKLSRAMERARQAR